MEVLSVIAFVLSVLAVVFSYLAFSKIGKISKFIRVGRDADGEFFVLGTEEGSRIEGGENREIVQIGGPL